MLKKTVCYGGAIHCRTDAISFSLYSAEEIKSLSVVQVITPLSFNALGHPLAGGLYDTAMGPYDSRGMCSTCQQGIMHCPGHFGHIELPLPVINPMFTKTLLQIFRLSCLSCHALTLPGLIRHLCITQLKLLNSGLVKEAQDAEFIMTEALALEQDGKKMDSKRVETEGMRLKFDSYLKEAMTSIEDAKSGIGDMSNQSVESLRRVVMKKILSYAKMNQKCSYCGSTCKKMMLYESRIIYTLEEGFKGTKIKEDDREDDSGKALLHQKYLTPLEARDHLRKTWIKEKDFFSILFPVLTKTRSAHPTDLLFVHVVPVPPPKNRPAQMIRNKMAEHPQNLVLRNVVTSCSLMVYSLQGIKSGVESLNPELAKAVQTMKGETLNDKLEEVWKELQTDVDHVMDRDKGQSTGTGAQMMGLKQVIEKKEGLFRMHMMGKRVNFAARTVITPDPNIHIEEIGIPDLFAKTLTFPTPVTHYNVASLRKLVLAGPDVHPGAVAVQNELGHVSRLTSNVAQRAGIAARLLVPDQTGTRTFFGIKTVYRHLQNGDLLLLNRQPSLHRPSIMAHRARVLYGDKVFRLHYANCKHYNADFDGDEMNAHFPQSHVARSEAASLVNACSNFLVPKDGTPLGGLIQDHVVAGVRMTIRGRFFNREDYHQLLFFALGSYSKHIVLEPPTILKPEMLWSGKQIISSILINLVPKGRIPPTFTSSAKIKSEEWRQMDARYCKIGGQLGSDTMSESLVIFRQGRLLSGVLDKVHLGATPYGLCHTFFELYGGAAVGNLLTAFSRLMTNFLQWEGFTLGVKDVLVKSSADALRREFMDEVTQVGPQAATEGVGIPPDASLDLLHEQLEIVHRSGDPKARARVDQAYKQTLDGYTNKINRACLPHGLVTIFPSNNLQLLVQSGAKGSTVNTMQMSCLLGQIELEGKRPPLTVSGKSLPSFKQYDPSPRGGGFIAGRFLTGIRPQEFFFHCMAGREGLIDTAVKTSRSGYLQRCLVKLLEGLVTQYDGTVRDSDGTVVQFLYGEDGMDVCKSQFLKEKLLDFHAMNSDAILDRETMEVVKRLGNTNALEKHKAKLAGWVAMNGAPLEKGRNSPSLRYFTEKGEESQLKSVTGFNQLTGRTRKAELLIRRWRDLRPEHRLRYEETGGRCPDPVLSRLSPDSNYGSISEALEGTLDRFLGRGGGAKSSKRREKAKEQLRNILYYKAMRALSSPGDAVGVLAGQSIGEPSTQMTLNTFHFAGRGEMNVTLGIPRLREILMVASAKIKTPSMDIPFLPHVTGAQAEALRLQLTRVTLAQVLQEVHVTESLDSTEDCRLFTLQFKFLTGSEYRHKFIVKPANVLKYFEKGFLRNRLIPIIRNLSKMSRAALIDGKESRKGRWKVKDANNPDEDYEDPETEKNLFEEAERTGTGEDHQSSDEEPDVMDADATQQIRKKKQGEAEYDAPEEDERIDGLEDDDKEDGGPEGGNTGEESEVKPRMHSGQRGRNEESREEEGDEYREEDMTNFRISSDSYESRVLTVEAMDSYIAGYDFDRLTEESCTLRLKIPVTGERVNIGSILKAEAEKAVIHQVKDISRAFVTGGAKEPLALKTEGINILAMAGYRSLLDLDRLHCNNIHIMAQHYGIEAASRVIVKEMTDVFKAYGIDLDKRHLTLIADYMTCSGTYRPFNRFGIEASSSPLHQMSFETVVTFLRDATLGGRRDELQNPSARLVVGKPTAVGTGIFGLHQRMT